MEVSDSRPPAVTMGPRFTKAGQPTILDSHRKFPMVTSRPQSGKHYRNDNNCDELTSHRKLLKVDIEAATSNGDEDWMQLPKDKQIEHRLKVEMQESQRRQVNLTDRLKDKVMKYRREALESRGELDALKRKSREDAKVIAELQSDLEQERKSNSVLKKENVELNGYKTRSELLELDNVKKIHENMKKLRSEYCQLKTTSYKDLDRLRQEFDEISKQTLTAFRQLPVGQISSHQGAANNKMSPGVDELDRSIGQVLTVNDNITSKDVGPSEKLSKEVRFSGLTWNLADARKYSSTGNLANQHNDQVQITMDYLKSKLETVKRSESKWKSTTMDLETDLAKTRHRHKELTRQKDDLKHTNFSLQEESERLDKQLKESDYKAEKFERKTELLHKQIISLNAMVSSIENESLDKSTKLEYLEKENRRLEEQVHALKESLVSSTDSDSLTYEFKNICHEEMIESKNTKIIENTEIEYKQEIINRDITESKLKSDLANSEITIADLKQELQEYESTMINFENDIKSLQWELRDKTELVASLEINLKETRLEKARSESLCESLQQKVDLAEDKAFQLMDKLESQRKDLQELSNELQEKNSEYQDKLSARDKEINDCKRIIRELESDRKSYEANKNSMDELIAANLELEDRLNDKEEQTKNLTKLNDNLKSDCFNLRNEVNKVNDDLATLKDNEKDLDKQIKMLTNENESIKDLFKKESDLIRTQLLMEKENDLRGVVDKYETEKKGLKDEIEFCNHIINNLNTRYGEALDMLEKANISVPTSDNILSEEELEDLRNQLENLKKQLKTEETEHYYVERSKTELNHAKSRITCLEDELHDITKKFEVDKENLNDEISQLKEINNEMNLKICVFLEQLSEYKNHVEKLKLELQYSRKRIEELEEEKDKYRSDIEHLHNSLLEAEKMNHQAALDKDRKVESLESKLEAVSVKEKQAISELTVIKEDLVIANQDYSARMNEIEKLEKQVIELKLELDRYKNDKSEDKSLSEGMNAKHAELVYENKKLEQEVKTGKCLLEEEREITRMRLDSVERSLEDSRSRERSLESVILNLESELIAKEKHFGDLKSRLQNTEKNKEELESKLELIQQEMENLRGMQDSSGLSRSYNADRSRLIRQIEKLKTENENQRRCITDLETDKTQLLQQINMAELQLKKLENKILASDEILADREESIQIFKSELQNIQLQLKELTGQKDSAHQEVKAIKVKLTSTEELAANYKHNLDKMLENMTEMQSQAARLQSIREGSGTRQNIQTTQINAEEDKLEAMHYEKLKENLTYLQNSLDLSKKENRDLGRQIQDLTDRMTAKNDQLEVSTKKLESIKRQNEELELRLRLLTEKMEEEGTGGGGAESNDFYNERIRSLTKRLQESERIRLCVEDKLSTLENEGKDKPEKITKELNRAKKENKVLYKKLEEMEKRVKIMKLSESETRISNKIVRSQIPLMSGKQYDNYGCGGHEVQIRALEKEVQRYQRRIRFLETQMTTMETKSMEHIDQLLQDKRRERESEHSRFMQDIKDLENSYKNRETMYKDRILSLQDHIHMLRDQMNQDYVSKKLYVLSTKELSSDVRNLRKELTASLDNVRNAGLDPATLNRETKRLGDTINLYKRMNKSKEITDV